jgi:hypothetical protein
MTASPLRPYALKLVVAFVVALVATAVVAATRTPAPVVGNAGAENEGNATHYYRLGSPYGGCGLPQEVIDSADFVALNVFDTPGDYTSSSTPVPAGESHRIGKWDNGRNCGRFVRVTLGDYCTGINDGARGLPFCRDGSWAGDSYNGATLTVVVADRCVDASAWCRDDPGHLGLSTGSLSKFAKNGLPVGNIDPVHWNNRRVSWSYVSAPGYIGDLRIGFQRDAQRSWPVITVSHLPNGIHGVEYLGVDGTWQDGRPNGDMGQSFIIGPTDSGGTGYRIRVRDATDALVKDGQVYSFTLPAECSTKCAAPYTPVDYNADGTSATSSEIPTTTTSTTTGVTTTKTANVVPSSVVAAPPPPPPPPPPPMTTTAAPVPPVPSAGCTVTAHIGTPWPGGFQVDFTVRNTGPTALSRWNVAFSFAGNQRMGNAWNAVVRQSGGQVAADNQSYNGSLAPGATTSWGAIVSGVDQPLSGLRCTGA